MSVVVSTCQEISQSPLNYSRTKQLYSFPKEKRFRDTASKMCDSFYEIPGTRDKRATSFGFGKKEDLAGNKSSPAPNRYQIASEFEKSKDKPRGFSLALGRNNVQFGGVFNAKAGKAPGPGQYTAQQNYTNIKYSMRAKTPVGEEKYTNRDKSLPGPGTYTNPLSFSLNGKYPHSGYKSIKMGVIHPVGVGRTRVLSASASKQPGPGDYDSISTMNGTGRMTVNKFRSSVACSFAQSTRQSPNSKNLLGNPGPGMYRLPSEFGYYEARSVSASKKTH